MPRVKIGPAVPDRETLVVEIARWRDLDIAQLRNRWQTVFGRRPPVHLPRHLLFRVLAYRLQADHLGDLDGECQRLLDRSESPEEAGQRAADLGRRTTELRPGTVLGREWNGRMHRVAVLADGFVWNGQTYASLSKVAFAITGCALARAPGPLPTPLTPGRQVKGQCISIGTGPVVQATISISDGSVEGRRIVVAQHHDAILELLILQLQGAGRCGPPIGPAMAAATAEVHCDNLEEVPQVRPFEHIARRRTSAH